MSSSFSTSNDNNNNSKKNKQIDHSRPLDSKHSSGDSGSSAGYQNSSSSTFKRIPSPALSKSFSTAHHHLQQSNSIGSVEGSQSPIASTPQPLQKSRLPNIPTPIKYRGKSFLIMDAPSEGNLDAYLVEMAKHGVTDIVRVCDPTYSAEKCVRAGIRVHEMAFADGNSPPTSVVNKWLALVDARQGASIENASKSSNEEDENTKNCIAVHCVAGLGRAPALVAIALIEEGMSALDAVAYLRERRRGAINNKQLRYLETYKPRSSANKCSIM